MGGAAWKRHTVRWAIQIIVLPHCVSWNSVTELSRDWLNWIWAARKAVAHSFQDLHSQGVCVCVSMISQQSNSFQCRMEKWGGVCRQSHPSPAVGGASFHAADGGLYIKGDGWGSCSLTSFQDVWSVVQEHSLFQKILSQQSSVTWPQHESAGVIYSFCALLSLTHFLSENAQGSLLDWDWPSEKDRKKSCSEKGDFEAFVSWSRRHSCPHAGEGKTDTSQPLLPFTFSNLSSPPEDPSTGFSHAPENHEV